MTIALGILAPDGVVIAADTQESFGYYGGAKISGYKIMSRIVESEHRSFAATGAGPSGYLDSLNQELADNFVDVAKADDLHRRFREKVQKFFNNHVIPMKVPPENQPQVIIGANWDGQPMMWSHEQSALFRCKHFITSGAGRAHASMLIHRLLPSKQGSTTMLAAYVAAFVIYQVKDYVEGCGMDTHVTILKNGNAQYVAPETIAELEVQFEKHLRSVDEKWLKNEKPLAAISDGLIQIKGERLLE